MKRLAFLGVCCVLAAGLTQCNNGPEKKPEAEAPVDTTATATAASSTAITDNWKIGVQMWTFRLFTFTEALDKVDSAGVKNIEAFWGQKLGGNMKGEFGVSMKPETRAQLKQLLQSKGISITAMGVISPATNAEWLKAFELGKDFGLSYITAEPRKDQWNYVDSLAGVYNIKVAIHDHPKPSHYWSPDSVLEATNGHPNIGALADIGHWTRNGLDPVECLKKLEGHVYGLHFKDVVKFGQVDAADTIVGKGVIKIGDVLQELKRQKFSGMLSIEHESNWEHNLPDVIEIVKFYHDEVGKLK
ncbi:sugar phosphate isomerase/epimerase family protein [Flavihumibacter profundi]|uniref:sugar phosphate isomerase/epimerase family protein n=1 Tax=Flavihumibacter profundi TaxID=2716883 RepID=UPI001CC3780E|nr:sugar phosphate isomerase/epimerase [Flavihumibacter profundi]MBZ5859315.1 sugar phosphate isomerase/epimerase [Flavihumibacter profundi]